MADARTIVVRGKASALVQDIEVGSHRLRSDEPASSGGTDQRPNPYDLLLAALGSCKSMTAALYARRKGWPLDSVTVRLRHQKVHADDCQSCETKDVLLDRIDCDLEFSGELTPEQRTRLFEIANRCPVHRTLTSEIDIRARLV
jgi:putative redox protein